MKLKRIIDLIDTKNSWGKEQLKTAILELLSEDLELKVCVEDLALTKMKIELEEATKWYASQGKVIPTFLTRTLGGVAPQTANTHEPETIHPSHHR